MRIGGDITPIKDPSGLYNPRVSVTKKRVTATILLNSEEAIGADDRARLLSTTIYQGAMEVLERIAVRDKEFDAEEAKKKLAFLVE